MIGWLEKYLGHQPVPSLVWLEGTTKYLGIVGHRAKIRSRNLLNMQSHPKSRNVQWMLLRMNITHEGPSNDPWSKVLLEKLIVAQLVKKFSAFYGTRRIITVFTIQSKLPLYFIVVFFPLSTTSLPTGLLPHQNPVCTSPVPHMSCPSHSGWLYHPNNIC